MCNHVPHSREQSNGDLTQTLTVVALSQTHAHMKLESFNGLFIKRFLVQRNVLNRTQYISPKHYEIHMRDFSSPGLHGLKGFGSTLSQQYNNVLLVLLFR